MKTKVYDQYGEIIAPGDIITYPGRCGSSIYMRTARVDKITTETDVFNEPMHVLHVTAHIDNYLGEHLRKVALVYPERATVIPKHKIQNSKLEKLLS